MKQIRLSAGRIFDESRFEEFSCFVSNCPKHLVQLAHGVGTFYNNKFYPAYLFIDCDELLLLLKLRFAEIFD